MPPKRPTLAPITDPGEQAKNTTEEGEQIQITDTMSLVVSSGGEQYVVKESGVQKTPSSTASPYLASNNSYARASGGGGGGRVIASSPASTNSAGSPMSEGPGALPTCMLGRISFDELELLEIIGHGSQGRVRKVKNRLDNQVLALKSIAFSSDIEPLRKALVHELERTTAIKHPNVVSSFEAYFRNGKMYVLMEFMDCGTLADITRKAPRVCGPLGLNEVQVAYIAREALEGMNHIHKSLIMHRDIKPANMLVNSQGRVKISDFGVAGDAHVQVHITSVGSTPYMSPERIKALPYTQACDIWSIGISIAEVAIGEYPFGQRVKGKVFELAEIITSEKAEPLWSKLNPTKEFSAELRHFVSQCLLPQETRPTAEALLLHPFITNNASKVTEAEMGKFFVAVARSSSSSSPSAAGMKQQDSLAA